MSRPDVSQTDIDRVTSVLASGHLSIGPEQTEFEESFAAYLGCDQAIAVSSGTAGLHLALSASGIGPGDFVITSPFSFIASANAIIHAGATPVFVDVLESNGNVDPVAVTEALARVERGDNVLGASYLSPVEPESVKGLLPVHVFGEPAPMGALTLLADGHGLTVIEDACEAIGATYEGKMVGTFGAASVFAFYPNKQMTTGEGGMIVTDDAELAATCRSLRNQGRDVFDEWLDHSRFGYNFRMDEMSAALGASQLERIEELLANRQRVAGWYSERLRDAPGLQLFDSQPETTRRSWFIYPVRIDDVIERDEVIRGLQERAIPSRPYFPAIHLQDHYRKSFGYKEGDFPVAERLSASCLALPFSGVMTEPQVDVVVSDLLEVLERLS
jgi:dTDP-4-amino-4,6-dideoxygalactose transaminase